MKPTTIFISIAMLAGILDGIVNRDCQPPKLRMQQPVVRMADCRRPLGQASPKARMELDKIWRSSTNRLEQWWARAGGGDQIL